MDAVNEIYKKYIDNWLRDFKGRGSVRLYSPLNPIDLSVELIRRVVNSRLVNPTIFVCVDHYNTRKAILDKCKQENINYENVTVLSADYVKAKFVYHYNLSIVVGLKEWTTTCDTVASRTDWFMYIIGNDVTNAKHIAEIYSHCPCVNDNVDSKSLNALRGSSPVEERRIAISMSDTDYGVYNKRTDYITRALNTFGDFETIVKCINGDKINNISSGDCRLQIAYNNGWSPNLDCSIPFNQQIDAMFNPEAILDYAMSVNGVIKERHILCDSNDAKLLAVLKIIRDNPYKRFIIVSKRGEFAAKITEFLNNSFGKEICGDYHDCIAARYLVDSKGNPVLYKSGVNKGKPRMIKATAISSANLAKYNNDKETIQSLANGQAILSDSDALLGDDLMSCLSIRNSSNSELPASCDGLILVSQNVGKPKDLIYRFNNLTFDSSPYIIYRLYLSGTYEENNILNEKVTGDVNIVNMNDDENNDEKIPNIVCG